MNDLSAAAAVRSASATWPGKVVIAGLGKTGLSCARYLRAQGCTLAIVDTRAQPPLLAQARAELPDVALLPGGLDPAVLTAAEAVVVSPGLPLAHPALQAAARAGIPLLGDVELFARAATAPVIAITGSNGKSTVTTLLGLMARAAGLRVAVGGNLGEPVLDLLDPTAALYVVELSSFQLETTHSLRTRAATVLNLSPDHLDRYPDLATYAAAKARIFSHCETAIVNRDDPAAAALAAEVATQIGFTLGAPASERDYGIEVQAGERWVCRGRQALLPVAAVRLPGTHNLANALAALALAETCALPVPLLQDVLASFPGLPHRSQLVAEHAGVRWINDSKGTNPGATIAALTGLVPDPARGRAVLIAGGDGKGADFSDLAAPVRDRARAVVLIGRDAPRLEQVLAGLVPLARAADMEDAVQAAARLAQPGDCVVLSPACASFDMFNDYQHRGLAFAAAVARWVR
ncbi:MAG: UDP-N-acetylmuramoyl-L-alanine--D-glutamate ligase [Chromatiaceae bacterium]|nr:MAG: UDP-N-acetylmuramoyl-L-alanine--D-glutamate ligase [Chromatiaceae bacterium]